MAEGIRLKIVTGSGTALDEPVSYVRIPTADGSVGVLPGHAPMLCASAAGRLKYRGEDGVERFVSVSDGVAGIEGDELTVLVREAKREE